MISRADQRPTLTVDFTDQDTLYLPCTHCSITWPVGITPENGTAMCLNDTFAVNVPDATYWGIQNFSLELSHTYIDETYVCPREARNRQWLTV